MHEKLIVKNLKVVYENDGRTLTALKDFSIKVKENQFVCLLGPTGCGKTTALNAIAGFIKHIKGEILLNGKKITKPTKDMGVVFQHNVLFPWKTIKDNIALGPKLNDTSKREIEKITNYYLQLIGLKKYANYYPEELSGGMKQRVELARVLANNPEIILMDEPFGALDAQTRAKSQEQLVRIYNKHKKTIIFVTHDIDEALLLSDNVIIMTKRHGKIIKLIKNNLQRPRSYKLTTDTNYIKLKKKIIKLL